MTCTECIVANTRKPHMAMVRFSPLRFSCRVKVVCERQEEFLWTTVLLL
jgi:hypothetical protein